MNTHLLSIWEKFEKYYGVPDLVTKKTGVLFLFESPHTDEVKHKLPLVGSSGKAVTRVLFRGTVQEPLGFFIADKLRFNGLYDIGIGNISSIPLQRKPYSQDVQRHNAGFVYLLEKLRSEWKNQSFSNQLTADLEYIMVRKFSQRLFSYKNVKVIIPCGKLSQSYVDLCRSFLTGVDIVENIPHPSQGLWDREADRIRNELLKYFD